MKTYSEKLRSPKWQKKRLEIFKRDKFKCTMCADTETELQVHHLKYTGEPWDAPNENLTTLCKHCHFVIEYLNKIKINVFRIEGDYDYRMAICEKGVYYFDIDEDKINPVMGFVYKSETISKLYKLLNR